MSPLVSICIPTFNGAAFIEEAMESALSQTYSNLEIVVSDDHSSDETITKIESFRNQTKIPIFIYHHEPHGIGANWNYCVSKAHGDYIKFLLYKSYYDHLFWQLHPNNQWKLLKLFHPLFKRLVSLKNNSHVNQ